MENESKTFVIYNVLPPYAQATGGSASETHDLQFGQNKPHMEANPSPSAPPTEWANPEYVLKESKSREVLVIKTEGSRCSNLCCEFWSDVCGATCRCISGVITALIIILIIVFVIRYYKTHSSSM